MKRLIKQIEQLLYSEECVVVPKVGAFLVHHEPAVTDETKGLIFPGHCRISFNATLKDNDGLLVRSYSDAFSFGYKRSLALLEKDIEELKGELLTSGVVQIGEVGKLAQAKGDDRIQFIPNPLHPFSIDYYGLRPVAMLPPIQAKQGKGERRSGLKGHIYYLPINLRTIGYSSVAAAMVAMAILIPNQRLTIPSEWTQHQAGFLTTQTTKPKVEKPETATAIAEAAPEAPQLAGFRLTNKEESEGRYYVVVATLSNEAITEKFIRENEVFARFKEEGGILVSNRGLHRIYAASFADGTEARVYLRELIKEEPFSTAWVHKE